MVSLADIQAAYYMLAATGVLVAAVFYILNLRISQKNQEINLKNQELMLKAQEQSAKAQQQTLETRQAQLFMNIYDQTKSSDFQSAWVKVIASTKWSTSKEYFELNKDPDFHKADNVIIMFYEGIGVLVREGLLDIRMVALLMCGMTQRYWDKYSPIVGDVRIRMGYTRYLSESEFLHSELVRYLGAHPELDTRVEKGKMEVT